MDRKRVTRYRTRIRKAMASFSAFGQMALDMEIENVMSQAERIALRDALLNSREPIAYEFLNQCIQRHGG